MPAIGEQIPDIEMLNEEGKPVKLSSLHGKKVVLYFYPKDFTGGCELQACSFRDVYPEITAKNAVVLGVSADDVDSHQKFHESLNLPFHLLVDQDFAVAKAWGLFAPRTLPDGRTIDALRRSQFVIDENGKIVDTQIPVTPKDSAPLALEKLS